tara:strand:+ start:195 stop:491 length:297 start_codon:yes stop_codon:yes gene_type:complete
MGKNKKMKQKIPEDKMKEYQDYMIEVLCQYKTMNPDKTVYLSEECFSEAYSYVQNMQKLINPEMMKQFQQMQPNETSQIDTGKSQQALQQLKEQFDMD